jgi:hypothetical protein
VPSAMRMSATDSHAVQLSAGTTDRKA